MPVFSECFSVTTLTEILQALVNTKQTGYLKVKGAEQVGFLAVENGVIINAMAGSYTALHALFQFVGWRDIRFEFHERPIPHDLSRDLGVYDPQVLIAGITAKLEELEKAKSHPPSKSALAATG